MNTFFLLSWLCFAGQCQEMPRLGPGQSEQCEVALHALINDTPLPPGFYVIGRCVEESES
jgi:hypothetical protein